MFRSRRDLLKLAAAVPAGAIYWPASAPGQGADYPSRYIRSICMFPAGTGSDVFVRYFAKQLQDLAGQTVVVENKVGASGLLATQEVAQSKSDGYTIYTAPGVSVFAAVPHLYKNPPYDPVRDFIHVTTLAKVAFSFVVGAGSPIKTFADLTDHLRERGDNASYAAAANFGIISAELYKAAKGLKTVKVTYKTVIESLNDLQSGQVAFAMVDPVFVKEQERAGRIRALAVTTADRVMAMPDTPGAREAGLPELDVYAWWSVALPAKTPQPIVEKLEAWFNAIVASDATRKFLNDMGADPLPGNRTLVNDLLARDLKAWGDYVALANIPKV